MPQEHDCEQYSEDWYRLRLGLPTASSFHHILTPTGVPTRGDRRKKYMHRLVAEKLLNQVMDDNFYDYWMKRGRALEQEAADAFMKVSAIGPPWEMRKAGFFTTTDGKVGASPDRVLVRGTHVQDREGVEIKCPSPWVQVEYLLEGTEDNYKPQVQGQMFVCGFQALHLWCYHPRMPPFRRYYLRDDLYCEKLARELFVFCNELEIETDRARGMGSFKLAELLRLSAEMGYDAGDFARVS